MKELFHLKLCLNKLKRKGRKFNEHIPEINKAGKNKLFNFWVNTIYFS